MLAGSGRVWQVLVPRASLLVVVVLDDHDVSCGKGYAAAVPAKTRNPED